MNVYGFRFTGWPLKEVLLGVREKLVVGRAR